MKNPQSAKKKFISIVKVIIKGTKRGDFLLLSDVERVEVIARL